MVPKTCSIDGCGKPKRKRGWCQAHYMRWYHHGDPLGQAARPTADERFWSKVEKSSECWLWTGTLNDDDYGLIGVSGRNARAHRYSWELHVGKIPDGMFIDHRCRNHSCVNPSHLRLATNKENTEHRALSDRNTSGYRGVTFNKLRNKWLAQVTHNGRNHYGGYFDDVHEAGAAAKALRNELFTHNDLDRRAA